jgi:hypothetical protein
LPATQYERLKNAMPSAYDSLKLEVEEILQGLDKLVNNLAIPIDAGLGKSEAETEGRKDAEDWFVDVAAANLCTELE